MGWVLWLWWLLGQECRFLRRVVFGDEDWRWVAWEIEVSGLEFMRVVSWRCCLFG